MDCDGMFSQRPDRKRRKKKKNEGKNTTTRRESFFPKPRANQRSSLSLVLLLKLKSSFPNKLKQRLQLQHVLGLLKQDKKESLMKFQNNIKSHYLIYRIVCLIGKSMMGETDHKSSRTKIKGFLPPEVIFKLAMDFPRYVCKSNIHLPHFKETLIAHPSSTGSSIVKEKHAEGRICRAG